MSPKEGIVDAVQIILLPLIEFLRPLMEAAGAVCIAVGFGYAVVQLLTAHIHRHTSSFTSIRLTFSRYLSLALEFQLASDILSTAVAPSWDELGKLAVTAVIRTALNFFLSREMREYAEKSRPEPAMDAEEPRPAPHSARGPIAESVLA